VGALRRLNHIEASLLAWRTTSRTGRINCTRRLPSHGNEQPSPTSSTPGSVTGVLARHRVTALRLPEVIDPGVSYGAARPASPGLRWVLTLIAGRRPGAIWLPEAIGRDFG